MTKANLRDVFAVPRESPREISTILVAYNFRAKIVINMMVGYISVFMTENFRP